ncbi:MAG TPA: hypothetical protein VFP65_11280 [Anaeromyxobacteraceae bacterium]|nr:hypothetical protein [Anaeromyxobacteraceae bacterium]
MTRGLPKCDCGDFIHWLVMVDGRRIPVNLGRGGSLASIWESPEDGRGRFLSRERVAAAREAGREQELRTSHHATCRLVERHRVPRAQGTLFSPDAA